MYYSLQLKIPTQPLRNTAGTIIQFTYGEDGVDPTRSTGGDPVDFEQVFAEVARGAKGKKGGA